MQEAVRVGAGSAKDSCEQACVCGRHGVLLLHLRVPLVHHPLVCQDLGLVAYTAGTKLQRTAQSMLIAVLRTLLLALVLVLTISWIVFVFSVSELCRRCTYRIDSCDGCDLSPGTLPVASPGRCN